MGMFDDLVPGGKKTGAAKLVNPDRTVLNDLEMQSRVAGDTLREYGAAQAAIKQLNPGPFRGAFLDAAIPNEGGSILDKIGATVIGGPARALGAISPQDVNSYQRLKGLQSQRVLQEQLAQKGPQTDSDAARLQLTELSPSKTKTVNEQVIRSGQEKAQRAQARAPFYARWANQYGLNGVDASGRSVEQAFQASLNKSQGWKVVK